MAKQSNPEPTPDLSGKVAKVEVTQHGIALPGKKKCAIGHITTIPLVEADYRQGKGEVRILSISEAPKS